VAVVLGVDAMLYEAFKVVTYMKSIIQELPMPVVSLESISY
jgi:hypothetical protein